MIDITNIANSKQANPECKCFSPVYMFIRSIVWFEILRKPLFLLCFVKYTKVGVNKEVWPLFSLISIKIRQATIRANCSVRGIVVFCSQFNIFAPQLFFSAKALSLNNKAKNLFSQSYEVKKHPCACSDFLFISDRIFLYIRKRRDGHDPYPIWRYEGVVV